MTEEQLLQKILENNARIEALQAQLEETQEALHAITTGQVDALVVYNNEPPRVYTLQGADHAYRVMVESIHEGAANLNAEGVILYGNKRLAELLGAPLEKMLGSTFYQWLKIAEHDKFRLLAQKGMENFARAEFTLCGQDTKETTVLISASMAEVNDRRGLCLVVTDLSEQKQAAARERELQLRLMEQREEERVTIARNLHDGPLQDLLGLSFNLQMMSPAGTQEEIATQLDEVRQSILKLAADLRGVCNELRPPNTIRFGLSKAIQYSNEEILSKNRGIAIREELTQDGDAIPEDVRTALFRIYQEGMNNILRHASATEVIVRLALDGSLALLEIADNGVGFQPPTDWVELARDGHFGLVGMRERAEAVGGSIQVQSSESGGTTIRAEVPCKAGAEGG